MGKRKKSPTETEPDQPPPEKIKRTDVAAMTSVPKPAKATAGGNNSPASNQPGPPPPEKK